LRAAEVLALPSHTESFGIAAAEALACGLPVLVSDRVGIWREIVAAGAGYVGEDTQEGVSRLLSEWIATPPARRDELQKRAFDCFNRHFEISRVAANFETTLKACGVRG
jgi:glycosyltransferase involved in cell wall biosynthesis